MMCASYVVSVHAGIQAMPCTKKYMYIARSIMRMRCRLAAPRKPVEPAGFVPPDRHSSFSGLLMGRK